MDDCVRNLQATKGKANDFLAQAFLPGVGDPPPVRQTFCRHFAVGRARLAPTRVSAPLLCGAGPWPAAASTPPPSE